MIINFYKYHGAGNDFVLIDNRLKDFPVTKETIMFLCDRHFGIGADGLMLLENHPEMDFTMRYFNSDGGEATLCGNGGRCIVAFAHYLGLITENTHFMAVDGPHFAKLSVNEGAYFVQLKMKEIDTNLISDSFTFLNTGSPHHIEWVDNVMSIDINQQGKKIRNLDRFKKMGGTNVNFIQVVDGKTLKIRTYERGVEDETLACGTGSTAAAILYAVKNKLANSSIDIQAVGGKLNVSFEFDKNLVTNIFLSGPAVQSFKGSIDITSLMSK